MMKAPESELADHFRLAYTQARRPLRPQVLADTTGHFPTMSVSNPVTGVKRLDSWKEIAAFFGRDERTVNRWEKLGLPVHRLPGTKGRVFAYTEELSAWLSGPKNAEVAFGGDSSADLPESGAGGLTVVGRGGNAVESESVESPSDEEARVPHPSAQFAERREKQARPLAPTADLRPAPASSLPTFASIAIWLAPLLVVAGLIAGLSFSHRETRYKNALAARRPPKAEAQELYLKGEYHWTKRTPEDLNKAVDYFTQSIVKDPSYAQAYVGLANCYNLLREFSVLPPDEAYPRALAAAQKAVELDDGSASAHSSLAFATYYWNWDPATAEREYKRALELDPNLVQGHHWYATFLLTSGRLPEALDQIEQARKLDPSSTTIQADKGLILFYAGRKSEAFTLLKQLESTDPALATTHGYLAAIYFDRKDYENFFAESKQAAQLRHDEPGLAIANAAERGFAAGSLSGMRKSMIPVQKEMVGRDLGSAYDLAANCALVGKKEEALRYLQVAYERRETGLLFLSRDPNFSTVHDDLVYKEITEHVGERFSKPQ
jgi:tetratricopeptide (TPR) repeat protein